MIDGFSDEFIYFSTTRSELEPFTAKQLQLKLSRRGLKIPLKDLRIILKTDPNIICLHEDFFITRAGFFSCKPFGIKPTEFEIKNKILIPGTRCVPFVEQETFPHLFNFFNETKKINKKKISLSLNEAVKYYAFYGNEFVLHYISNDPANYDIRDSFFTDEVFTVDLTVLDMSDFYEKNDFQYGDWIIAKVMDWEENTIFIEPELRHDLSVFERRAFDEHKKNWEDGFVKAFTVMTEHFGMGKSIEDQICWTYFVYGRDSFSMSPGSIENAIQNSDNIVYNDFGVETRLWIKNKKLTLKGNWINNFDNQGVNLVDFMTNEAIAMRDSIITAYSKQVLFFSIAKNQNIAYNFFDDIEYINTENKNYLYAEIFNRVRRTKPIYNMLKDFYTEKVRSKCLDLYKEMYRLVILMNVYEVDYSAFPVNETIIFVQTFVQLCKTIDEIVERSVLTEIECESYLSPIEGMEMVFWDIKDTMSEAISKHLKRLV